MSRGEDKARRILNMVSNFQMDVDILDGEQAGDYLGLISPIKHAIRDALAPHLEALREAARTYWQDQTEKGA